ncbi:MAG: hypothetical protein ACI9VT_001246 [Psychroserpens sp.]|jgi:hypothetical protein
MKRRVIHFNISLFKCIDKTVLKLINSAIISTIIKSFSKTIKTKSQYVPVALVEVFIRNYTNLIKLVPIIQ